MISSTILSLSITMDYPYYKIINILISPSISLTSFLTRHYSSFSPKKQHFLSILGHADNIIECIRATSLQQNLSSNTTPKYKQTTVQSATLDNPKVQTMLVPVSTA